jgi:hypothetical protein
MLLMGETEAKMSNAIVGFVKGHHRTQDLLAHLEEAGVRIDDDLVLLAGEGSASSGGGARGLLTEIVSLAAAGIGTLMHHSVGNNDATAEPEPISEVVTSRHVFASLIQLGISEDDAKRYDDKARDNELVVAVHVEDPEAERTVEEALRKSGAHDVSRVPEGPVNDVVPHVA